MQCITFDRYIEGFHLLSEYSEEYPFMLRYFLEVSQKNFPAGFSLLDIGAGTGHFTRQILKESRVPVRSYTAIEPSADHIRHLEGNLRDLSVKRMIIPEFFTPRTDLKTKFDLILLSHSTYCFLPDPEPFLLHAFSFLNPGGKAVIYNGTPSTFCYLLNLLHKDILPMERVTNPFFTSWQIRDILEKNQIPHSVTYLSGYLRGAEVFRPENESLMNELITFSLMVEAESLDPGLLARTREFLREISYPSAEGLLLNLGVDAILVEP